jgi:hypothetical protein
MMIHSLFPKDKKELAKLLKQANLPQRSNWRRTLLALPLVMALLAGCAKATELTKVSAAAKSATSPTAAEMTPVAPTLVVRKTVAPTIKSPIEPTKKVEPTAQPMPTAKVEATATSVKQEHAKQIENAVLEINNFFDYKGSYSAENLEKVLFYFKYEKNTTKLGRFDDGSLEGSVMYPVNIQAILLGVVYEEKEVMLFWGTEDNQGKRFIFPTKITRDYENIIGVVVLHRLSSGYDVSGTDLDIYALDSDLNVDRFARENLGKPSVIMLFHREVPKSSVEMFINSAEGDEEKDKMKNTCVYISQNPDVVRAIANKARKVLLQRSVYRFPSPAKDVGEIISTGKLDPNKFVMPSLDRVPPIGQIIVKKQ